MAKRAHARGMPRARRGLNGLRMETAKYVSPTPLEWFGNATESAAKHHRYAKHTPFDEIYTNKDTHANSGGTAITPSITRGLPKAIHIRSPWSRSRDR